jgi:formyltetrahydrofolate synthetase
MAKTQYSLSHDPTLKGSPIGFDLPIHEIRAYTGAGFLCPIAGEIMTMPGLPHQSTFEQIDIDEHENIIGLL